MRKAILGIVFLLAVTTWGDTLYYSDGKVEADVRVVHFESGRNGPVVVIEQRSSPNGTAFTQSVRSGVVHIEAGDSRPGVVELFPTPPMVATVRRAVDGDTLELTTDEHLRLIGVDTPETVHPQKAEEYLGKEASQFTEQQAAGKKVWIEFDRDRTDKYRRLLGYVFLPGGTLLNEQIVAKGYSRVYEDYPFALSYMERLRVAEAKARKRAIGIWCPNSRDEVQTAVRTAPVATPTQGYVPKTINELERLPAAKASFPPASRLEVTPSLGSQSFSPYAALPPLVTPYPSATPPPLPYSYVPPDGEYSGSASGFGEFLGPKTVHVRPYLRSDGTPVRGYDRRAPSRGGKGHR